MKIDPENPIPEKIRKFLETPEGKRFFAEISDQSDRRAIFRQRKSFLEVPANVRRWLAYRELVEKMVDNLS